MYILWKVLTMDASVNRFDPVAYVLGAEKVIDARLDGEQCWELVCGVVARLKPMWKELRFAELTEANMALDGCPEELKGVHVHHVYGGQQHNREEQPGYVTYYVTRGRKWLRIFTGWRNEYLWHDWLSDADMVAVLAEDPSLVRYLLQGFRQSLDAAASKLRRRAEVIKGAAGRVEDNLVRLGALDQPWPRDLPSSTPRLLT